MELEMHAGVKLVAEFMQRNLRADELRGVASALALIAPVVWGHHPASEVAPLSLGEPPLG